MARVRADFVEGIVSDNPLLAGATTLNSDGLADLPAVNAPDDAVIIIDPEGEQSGPEIVYVTAHTAGATSATISATVSQHPQGTEWVHGAIAEDYHDAAEFSPAGHDHDTTYVNEVDHTKAAHDALLLDAATLDGLDSTAFATSGHDHDAAYEPLGHGHAGTYSEIGHTHPEAGAVVDGFFVPSTLAPETIGRIMVLAPSRELRRIEANLRSAPVGADASNCLQVTVSGAGGGARSLLLDGTGDLAGRHYAWRFDEPEVNGSQSNASEEADGSTGNVNSMATKVMVGAADLTIRQVALYLIPDAGDTLPTTAKRVVILDGARTEYIGQSAWNFEALPTGGGWVIFDLDAEEVLAANTAFFIGLELDDNLETIKFGGVNTGATTTPPTWDGTGLVTYVGDPDAVVFLNTEVSSTPLITAATTRDAAQAMRLYAAPAQSGDILTGDYIEVALQAVGTPPADPGADLSLSVETV